MFKQLFCLKRNLLFRSKSRTRRSHHHLFPGYRNENTDGSYDSFLVHFEEMQYSSMNSIKKEVKKGLLSYYVYQKLFLLI